jgi:poly(3-hydroxybutyrate) depolymerase
MKLFPLILSSCVLLGSANAFPFGCPKRLPVGIEIDTPTNVTLVSGGIERRFLVNVPTAYSSQLESPVIISYHGGLQTAEQQLALDQFTNPFFQDFAIVVYPQGIADTWQGIPTANKSVNDIQFTSDIIDYLEQNYCIDQTRIWASGKSDGAGFCNTLACDPVLSTKIAAFAPVSAAVYVNSTVCEPDTIAIPCNPGRWNIPMMEFHGEQDPIIAYDGGPRKEECLPSIPHWITEWAIRDGLPSQNISIPVVTNTTAYTFGDIFEWGLVVEVSTVNNGHTWPATVPNEDNQVAGQHLALFNATSMIIKFFENHPLTFF